MFITKPKAWRGHSFILCALLTFSATSGVQAATFNFDNDLLIAQFDGLPDADDVHAQAALGSLLQHSDFAGVQTYGVMGAYGEQTSKRFWDSRVLMDMVFGSGNANWTNAHEEYARSVQRIANRAEAILNGGGHVWVQEAGQSNITADWLRELKSRGFSGANLRSGVTVVQHSDWNELKTADTDLDYVKNNANYVKIDDGNHSDNGTPDYQTDKNDRAIAEHAKLLIDAKSSDRNPNAKTRAMWREADRLLDAGNWNKFPIGDGALDFSDCVENWYIFKLGTRANTIEKFWARYVVAEGDPGAGSELVLLDDAFVNVNNSDRNYNGRGLKVTKNSKKCIYLKFDASGYSGSQDAILSLHCIDPGRGKINVFVADSNFKEEAITYDNQPGYSGASLGSINQSYAAGSDYFINLSRVPLDGTRVSLVLVIEGSGSQSAYDSKETNEANKPMLELVGGGAG